jgi:hypothetical protein
MAGLLLLDIGCRRPALKAEPETGESQTRPHVVDSANQLFDVVAAMVTRRALPRGTTINAAKECVHS